jgi:hypothetical protein
MGLITGRQSAEAEVAEHADKAHGLIDKIVSAVKHVHEEHVQREHAREEHQFEEVQHLAEHNHDVDRENLPF